MFSFHRQKQLSNDEDTTKEVVLALFNLQGPSLSLNANCSAVCTKKLLL